MSDSPSLLVFGAHPDDCEFTAGGLAALYAVHGSRVCFVSVTNGDAGHQTLGGTTLARIRREEARCAAAVIGIESRVLDNHDGELTPTLERRREIIGIIRDFRPDLILTPRPNDYHPDHRYTSILVQDAAYMVTVPFICPDVPHMNENPVFMYYTDRFQKPYPSQADVVVNVDPVMDKKLDALAVMESQFLEGGANGHEGLMPRTPAHREHRVKEVRDGQAARFRGVAERYRKELAELYGKDRGERAKYAEAFEVCEYGRRPDTEELRKLFPFFDGQSAAVGESR